MFFGGYPGAAPLIGDPARWVRYLRDGLIETSISRDVLLLTRVDKPALLRRLFELGGTTPAQARSDPEYWGRLVESAVGAHLANAAMRGECTLHYWRERNHEVDFVVQSGRSLVAIEVKSGRAPLAHPGTAAFVQMYKPERTLLVGGDGIALEDFLLRPVAHWMTA